MVQWVCVTIFKEIFLKCWEMEWHHLVWEWRNLCLVMLWIIGRISVPQNQNGIQETQPHVSWSCTGMQDTWEFFGTAPISWKVTGIPPYFLDLEFSDFCSRAIMLKSFMRSAEIPWCLLYLLMFLLEMCLCCNCQISTPYSHTEVLLLQ